MFRPGGIYILPNGRELVASGDDSNFYAVANDGESILRYELNEAGRLLLEGRLTAWDVTNLDDSHRTVEAPSTPGFSQTAEFVAEIIV